ncbi:MAG: ImmA/IrrE family metallo-endopeptidase [Eubacteriales bacterium]
MELVALQKIAERHHIDIAYRPMGDIFAMCLCLGDGDFAIAVNTRHITTAASEKAALAHELGHCATDSFYNINTPVLTRGKCERRADEWSIKKLVPKNELKKAIREGNTETWQLADCFEVEERFMIRALEYYNL